jgi:hypothetical protein
MIDRHLGNIVSSPRAGVIRLRAAHWPSPYRFFPARGGDPYPMIERQWPQVSRPRARGCAKHKIAGCLLRPALENCFDEG